MYNCDSSKGIDELLEHFKSQADFDAYRNLLDRAKIVSSTESDATPDLERDGHNFLKVDFAFGFIGLPFHAHCQVVIIVPVSFLSRYRCSRVQLLSMNFLHMSPS